MYLCLIGNLMKSDETLTGSIKKVKEYHESCMDIEQQEQLGKQPMIGLYVKDTLCIVL